MGDLLICLFYRHFSQTHGMTLGASPAHLRPLISAPHNSVEPTSERFLQPEGIPHDTPSRVRRA